MGKGRNHWTGLWKASDGGVMRGGDRKGKRKWSDAETRRNELEKEGETRESKEGRERY